MRFLGLTPLIFCLLVSAQPPQLDGDDLSLSLGFAVVANQEGYGDDDNQILPIPLIDLRYQRFSFQGIQAGFDLVQSRTWSWKITARPEFNGFEEDDGEIFAGMDDRELAAMVGTSLDFRFANRFSLSMSAETDVSGRNDGHVAEVSLSRLFTAQRTLIIPSIGVQWQSEDFNRYYYGVRPEEARPFRPAYQPEDAFAANVGVLVSHPLSEKMTLTFLGQWQPYPSEIENSPLVDEAQSLFGFFGLSWKIR